MKISGNIITADEGKTLVRIADGMVAGESIDLGKTWYIGGQQLAEPIQELPEHYTERDATEGELARRRDVSPVIEAISIRTQEAITNKFSYKGHDIKLSVENQINYKETLEFAKMTGGKNIPTLIKAKFGGRTTYLPINSISALEDFCLAMRSHIDRCLQRGWDLKRDVESRSWEGLPQWLTDQFPFLLVQ